MKIEWDETNNIISIGKSQFKSYVRYQNSASWANKILSDNEAGIRLNEFSKNPKCMNKSASDALGCSRSVLYSHFNKLQLKAFVAPVYGILEKVAFKRGGFSAKAIRQINLHKEKLQETYNDKLYNILPIIMITGKSPKELKAENKQAWKIVAGNSLNKNKALARYVEHRARAWSAVALAQLPTTLLQYKGCEIEELKHVEHNHKGSWNNWKNNEYHFRDCIRLAEQLGLAADFVDPKWTPRRVKEEHDKLIQDLNTRKYSKDVFESCKGIIKELTHEGFHAKLLDSAFLIAEEGTAMGHCVAGYSGNVKAGDYLVYSITKSGERSSTLGISIKKGWRADKEKPYYIKQQHYLKYNRTVTDEVEKEFAEVIVKRLNGGELDGD